MGNQAHVGTQPTAMQLWEMPHCTAPLGPLPVIWHLKCQGTSSIRLIDGIAPKELNPPTTMPFEDSPLVATTSFSPCLAWGSLVQPARESGKCSFWPSRFCGAGTEWVGLANQPQTSWSRHMYWTSTLWAKWPLGMQKALKCDHCLWVKSGQRIRCIPLRFILLKDAHL